MQITFWGVRGSYPVPGPSTVRYGGHTSCVEVRNDAGACLIVDAGTGLRGLGHRLAEQDFSASRRHYDIVLSHVHWDHIQGLPFFEPAYLPSTEISIHAMRAAADELQQVIGGITRQEFFPVPLEAVPADFEFHEVIPGESFRAGPFELFPVALNHPFGAVGYRIRADGVSVAYVSDTAPFTDLLHKRHFLPAPETPSDQDRAQLALLERGLREALEGVDTVIYDTHFLPDEYARFPHWGHSTPDHALEICSAAHVRRLVLYHHAPSHTDDQMDEVAAAYRERGAAAGLVVDTAREGMTLVIGERAA